MKKSQLRKIIRESIKELMNEQSNHPFAPFMFHIETCPCSSYDQSTNSCSTSTFKYNYLLIAPGMNGANVNTFESNPQIGGTICNGVPGYNNIGPFCPGGNPWRIIQFQQGWQSTPVSSGIIRKYSPNGCPGSAIVGPSPSGCDKNAPFPPNFNLQSWTNTWTNLGPFNSSNPNQPCNFICGKRNQWQNQINAGGMGPKQTNQVACKLEEAENQYQIHGCAQMNTNNCP